MLPYAPSSMFTRYRTVLTHSGAWRFSLTAFVARLPISISTLGIVLLATGLGKSYGLAGALSASFTIASGLSSVVQGRLFDRLGQAVVLPVVIAGYAVGVVGLVTSLEAGSPVWVSFACGLPRRSVVPTDRVGGASEVVATCSPDDPRTSRRRTPWSRSSTR